MTSYDRTSPGHNELTHWGWDKIGAISQTAFSNEFSWMKMYEYRFKNHWSLFLRVQLTISQYWIRKWLGADQATSHYVDQWWLDYRRIYASLGLNELRVTFFHIIFTLSMMRWGKSDWNTDYSFNRHNLYNAYLLCIQAFQHIMPHTPIYFFMYWKDTNMVSVIFIQSFNVHPWIIIPKLHFRFHTNILQTGTEFLI